MDQPKVTSSQAAQSIAIRSVNPQQAGDLFGLEAEFTSELWGWTAEANADISTLNPENIANGSRFWGELKKSIDLPLLGDVKARLFSAYRYKAYNGSLGETDVYSAFGSFLEQRGNFRPEKFPMTTFGV
jgi:hypothetical protein